MSSTPLGRRIAPAERWEPDHYAALGRRRRGGHWPTWVFEIIGEEDVDGQPIGVTAAKRAGITRIPPERRDVRA